MTNKKETIDFEKELYEAFGQVKDFTLGVRIAKRFYEMGKVQTEAEIQAQSIALAHGCTKKPICDDCVNRKGCINCVDGNLKETLTKEPVSEDLEEAAKEWEAKTWFTPFYMTLDDNGNPNEVRQDYTTHAESFKAGAKWKEKKDQETIETAIHHAYHNGRLEMKEQMMAKAIDMVVGYWMPNGLMLTVDETENCYNIDEGDRVKAIIIKKEEL